jgi:high-affinity iron transporter
VNWAEAVPNLLIGLREGLEAGLVVSILLAALRKLNAAGDRGLSSAPVWLRVLGAVMVAGSFAAVLTFGTDALSSRAQEAVGGLLSVLAVGLVTGMIFWMRRTARTLSAQLRQEVTRAEPAPMPATSCRSTSNSAFLDADERPGKTSQPRSRMKIR